MDKQPNIVKRFFSATIKGLNITRKIIINLLFFLMLILFISVLTAEKEVISVPKNSALVLNLSGNIVEQKQRIAPIDAFISDVSGQPKENPEVLLQDIIDVIKHAKYDDNIKLIVLKLNHLKSGGLTKMRIIGRALDDFKQSGKQIIALGDGYTQDQYYLASYADKVWLNPQGWLLLEGYGAYPMYYRAALEKLKISQHIFRVGTYKSAVEPYMRDNMSPAAKEANQAWLTSLWQQFKQDVAEHRAFDISNFDDNAKHLIRKLAKSNGSIAEYALANHWVDELKTREQMRQELIKLVGKNEQKTSFKQIGFERYLASMPTKKHTYSVKKVAVIVAKGTILDGQQKPGTIGGDSLANLLRKARNNDRIKAVVLRVDSPGGSAYASEIIRQEIELLKQAGKPVVASMGSVAASGGYWISAPADAIVAEPTTITGSIGIFGMMMTFENSLDYLGIHSDGVGTTDLAGFGVTRPMSAEMKQLFQMVIERGYQDFIQLVAKNRHMTPQAVDKIAQGRVWTGQKALELGLVDQLGNLHDAVKLAATKAKLAEFEPLLIEQELSAREKMLQQFFGMSEKLGISHSVKAAVSPAKNSVVQQIMQQLEQQVSEFVQFNDPQNMYTLCLPCQAAL